MIKSLKIIDDNGAPVFYDHWPSDRTQGPYNVQAAQVSTPSKPTASDRGSTEPAPYFRYLEAGASAVAPSSLKSGAVRESTGIKLARLEWAPPLLFLALDVVLWILLSSAVAVARGNVQPMNPVQWIALYAIEIAVVIIALWVVGGYQPHSDTRTLSYMAEHMLALAAAAGFTSLLIYSAAAYDQAMKPSRSVLLITFVAFAPLSLAYRRLVSRFVAASTAQRAFLVIGSGELAADFYRAYRGSANRQRLEFVGLDAERVGTPICGAGSPVIEADLTTKLDRLDQNYSGVIIAERVDRIRPDLLQRLIRTQFQAARVYTLESFYEAQWKHVPVHSLDPFWPLQTGFQLTRTSPYHYLKRLFDILFATGALLVCLPLIALLTLLVWWRSGKPALFRQPRVGREGDVFTIYKFRTMRHHPEIAGTDMYTRIGDPRVTTLGRWLRKLRLDELPQLWNVLRGEMSLIGPRAEWTKCAERYERVIPFYHFRHLVKPGITGWAQVNYPYGESDRDALEKLKYDLYYIRHYSLKLDAMIVLKTVHTMLFGKGQ